MAGLTPMEKKLAEYKCDTNEAIKLKLVRFQEDIEDESTTFNPEFSHQLFGDDEVAFGYKGLQMQLYYSAGSLSTMFRVLYTANVNEKFDSVQYVLGGEYVPFGVLPKDTYWKDALARIEPVSPRL